MQYRVAISKKGYKFRGGAAKMFRTRQREVMLSGPYETGKTLAVLYKLHLLNVLYPGSHSMMVMLEYSRIVSNMYPTFQKILPLPLDHPLSPITAYGGIESPKSLNYWNGSKIRLAGINDDSKVLSSEYDWICVSQAEHLSLENWEQLTTRCTGRAQHADWCQILGDCNPGPEHHWILNRKEILFLEQFHRDNPFLCEPHPDHPDDEKYDTWTEQGEKTRKYLMSLSGLRYQRGFLNKWVGAEGMVYEGFSKEKHLLPHDYKLNPNWKRFISIDWGHTHPFVAQWWAVDPEGVMYMYREIYMTKRQTSEHVDMIKRLSEGEHIRYVVPDPRRPDHIDLLKQYGFRVQIPMTDVSIGIQLVQDRLRLQPNDRYGIYFLDPVLVELDSSLADGYKAKCTVDSIQSLVWKPRNKMTGSKLDEEPLKQNDDGADATRYAVVSQDAAVPTTNRVYQGSVRIGADRYDDKPAARNVRTRIG